jgi:glycosyltransferase involved in cell wall biosynthesis
MRILTIGAKSTINTALAKQEGVEVWSMSIGGDVPTGVVGMSPYQRHNKINRSSIEQVRHAIQESQPDLIHAFYPRPLAHALFAMRKLRSQVPVVSFRGITAKPIRWSPDQWITYLSPRVAAHACESEAVRESLLSVGVPREKCHVVYNAPGPRPPELSREEARRELGIARDAFVVMMVANMRRVKGADILVEAAKRCLDLPGLQVLLVGRVLDSRLDRLAADPKLAGRLQLHGYEPHASRLLAAGDLFVMPSRQEALCVALLEAMSAGLCPLVSDAGGMKEVVRHGTDGLVFPRENPAALAAAIRELYHQREPMKQYAASAQARATSEFTATAVAERLVKLYNGVLHQRQHVAA